MNSIQIYFTLVVVFLLGLLIRFIYERLKLAGKIDTKNKLIFSLIFATMMLIWASWFVMCSLDPWKFKLPGVIQWSGMAVFILGLILAFGALFKLRGVENIQHLAVDGIFKKLRHPMYMGFIFWILGWSVYQGAILSLAIGFIAIGNILYWRSLEEKELESRYGETYRAYQQTTWF